MTQRAYGFPLLGFMVGLALDRPNDACLRVAGDIAERFGARIIGVAAGTHQIRAGLIGYAAEDIPAGAHVHDHNLEFRATGHDYDVEHRIVRKDGSTIWVHDHAFLVEGPDGRRAWNGVLTDVTDRKVAEALAGSVVRASLDPIVVMEVFGRRDAVLCGIDEAKVLLAHVLSENGHAAEATVAAHRAGMAATRPGLRESDRLPEPIFTPSNAMTANCRGEGD